MQIPLYEVHNQKEHYLPDSVNKSIICQSGCNKDPKFRIPAMDRFTMPLIIPSSNSILTFLCSSNSCGPPSPTGIEGGRSPCLQHTQFQNSFEYQRQTKRLVLPNIFEQIRTNANIIQLLRISKTSHIHIQQQSPENVNPGQRNLRTLP